MGTMLGDTRHWLHAAVWGPPQKPERPRACGTLGWPRGPSLAWPRCQGQQQQGWGRGAATISTGTEPCEPFPHCIPSAQLAEGSEPFPHCWEPADPVALAGGNTGNSWPVLHLWKETCPSAVLSLPTPIPSTHPKGLNIRYPAVEGVEGRAAVMRALCSEQ